MSRTRKFGIFGGSFNPMHIGHVSSLLFILRRLGLDKIFVVPTNQTPLRSFIEGPSAEERLKMVELSLHDHKSELEVSRVELERGGLSYSIDTIKHFRELYPNDELHLIIGADQFENFTSWKEFDKILQHCHVVVTSRPGAYLPTRLEEFPQKLRDFIEIFDSDEATLTTGHLLKFVQLKDVNISASEIRRRIRARQGVDKYLAPKVIDYIEKHKLYAPYSDRVQDFSAFTQFCATQLFERKAIQVRAYDLRELEKPSEFALIASGTSTRHTSGLAEYTVRRVKEEFGFYPYNIEGQNEGRWVVLDYGSLIVHLFYDFARNEYRLEDLWKEAKELALVDIFATQPASANEAEISQSRNRT